MRIGVMGARGSFSEMAGNAYVAQQGETIENSELEHVWKPHSGASNPDFDLRRFASSLKYLNIPRSPARVSASKSKFSARKQVSKHALIPLISAENVLQAVEEQTIDVGILPIENSNGGVVLETVYAMAAHTFAIEKLFEIDIHHNLLVKPGTKREAIKKIVSHDQALRQCRQYLKRFWADTEVGEYSDTAQAAHDLAEGVLPEYTAVIAPLQSAHIYNLEILEESIQDLKYNYTSFLAVTKQAKSS